MKIVIIGSGLAGISAASEAYSYNPKAKILVCSETEYIAFDPCTIPFVISRDLQSLGDVLKNPPISCGKCKGVRLNLGTKVAAIDVSSNIIQTQTRDIRYDALIIATGSYFSIPNVKGHNLKNIFTAKTVRDVIGIEQALSRAKKVTVCGAGPLGVEMAIALAKRKMKVTVIDRNPQIFYEALDPEIAFQLQKILEMKNIEISLNTRIVGFSGKDRVEKVVTSKNEIDSDLVILATKTVANTGLALKAGLKLNKLTGAVCVNEFLQTSDKNVYAAGDCAEIRNFITGASSRCKLGSTAVRMGKTAGINAAGGKMKFQALLTPWIVPLNGYAVGRVGCTVKEALNAGYEPRFVCFAAVTRPRYYPRSPEMRIMLIADKSSRRVLGAQILGSEGVKERIDFLAYSIKTKAQLEDLISIENCYAPSVASLVDPIVQTANELLQVC